MGNILLAARGEAIGAGSLAFIEKSGYSGLIDTARDLLARYGEKICLPGTAPGWRTAAGRRRPWAASRRRVSLTDIGAATAKRYQEIIRGARTVFVNGPMGVFEQAETELGTSRVWDALGDTAAYTVVGGGDSITATAKYGKTDRIDYICTGGGALIRFLTGEELPVVAALRQAAEKWGAGQ